MTARISSLCSSALVPVGGVAKYLKPLKEDRLRPRAQRFNRGIRERTEPANFPDRLYSTNRNRRVSSAVESTEWKNSYE
jgi:hypothetical protein